ncbi:uncharacterized protein Eint_020780 [Encephalitozoon intestinalis ATCC 50506]|uniref:DUF8032 domain-containing protein n=1 Tax=Encephalitozoon intestinalis (strain ATCC 50506) TaxID=876142 RepID=E0S5U2_ENCIT|nr:uncharacterized protein Eint_020780 [Encephalitozoon intestinalis ATCC 50506]ADM11077.1 hypothetical protein Eint_020780 [Encephalitozoon intestinalis ATCC 50506]UTX44729.1 hypothetical protein GPK93_02g02460 [Encephalitozoon intestinalis]
MAGERAEYGGIAGGQELIYHFQEDSDDLGVEKEYEENEPNSLRLRNFVEDELYQSDGQMQYRGEDEMRLRYGRKKKEKRKKKKNDENKRPSNRKIVNLPASPPYVRFVDGEERLCFKYVTKVSESARDAMPKTDLEDNEFCVRFDLDSVDISKLNEKFKADNCVYPRANLPYEMYTGNRWGFETECNRLAWQFVSLNPVLLYGKKGLIQRAVDSYRTINKQSRNKRIVKEDRFPSDIEKRKHVSGAPSTITIQWTNRGILKKCKIQVNIENINYGKIDDEFKSRFSVFMDDFDDKSFGKSKWESHNVDNELAVKIAFLNVENTSFWNAIKALDKTTVLKKAIEAYKQKRDEYASSDDDTEMSDVIASALGSSLGNSKSCNVENFYFDN